MHSVLCTPVKRQAAAAYELEIREEGLADSKEKCITVIKPRCDEGLDYCLKVLLCRKGLHLCQLPKVKEAGLNY